MRRCSTDFAPRSAAASSPPATPRYDDARTLMMGGVDRRPAVIVRVADAADVARVIALARDDQVPLAVRSGGHSAAAHSVVDDGIVLDLRDLHDIEIDVDGRTAWAGAGVTAAAFTTAARGARPRRSGSATPGRSGSAGSPSAAASATSCASTA